MEMWRAGDEVRGAWWLTGFSPVAGNCGRARKSRPAAPHSAAELPLALPGPALAPLFPLCPADPQPPTASPLPIPGGSETCSPSTAPSAKAADKSSARHSASPRSPAPPFRIDRIRGGRPARPHAPAPRGRPPPRGDLRGRGGGRRVGLRAPDLLARPRPPRRVPLRHRLGRRRRAGPPKRSCRGLMLAGGPSAVTLEGGTHNPFAPPLDFLEKSFLPLPGPGVGPRVTIAPGSGGASTPPAAAGSWPRIEPAAAFSPLSTWTRRPLPEPRRLCTAVVAGLPEADRQPRGGGGEAGGPAGRRGPASRPCALPDDQGPGNVVLIEVGGEAGSPKSSPASAAGASAPRTSPPRPLREAGGVPRVRRALSGRTWPTSCCCRWPWPAAARSSPAR